jgi:hypothetical protein
LPDERGTAFLWLVQAKAASRGIPLAARTPKQSTVSLFLFFSDAKNEVIDTQSPASRY